MRLILRNFINTLKHYSQSSIFNILGLSLAFMACYIIYVQTSYEFGYGKVHKDYDRIHRIGINADDSSFDKTALSATLVKREIDKFAIVESSTLIDMFTKQFIEYDTDAGRINTDYNLVRTDTCLNNVFEVDMVLGVFDDISIDNNVVVPLSMANDLWNGAELAMDKKLYTGGQIYIVTGIYKDFTEQSVIPNNVYFAPERNYDRFNGFNDVHYFKVVSEVNEDDIQNMLNEVIDKEYFDDVRAILPITFYSTPLGDIYFSKARYVSHPIGDKTISISLIFAAIVILLIAMVNFINFSIAIAPQRIKAINTYRVLGHSLVGLRVMIVFEAVFTSFIALILSLVFVEFISGTSIADVIATNINPFNNIDALVVTSVMALLVGMITGVYPAIYMTKFTPALVLNGGKSLPVSAHNLRRLLIIFQYIISITMILVSLFINSQTRYLLDKGYGYDIDNTLVVDISNNLAKIEKELLKYPNITHITAADNNLISNIGYSAQVAQVSDDTNLGIYESMRVQYNFPETMGLDIFEGGGFVEGDQHNNDDYHYILLNETAKNLLGAKIGDIYYGNGKSKVKGFFRDINHSSLHKSIVSFSLRVASFKKSGVLMVKYDRSENRDIVMESVAQTISEFNTGDQPPVIDAYEYRARAYKKDIDLNTLILWSAVIAIFIATIGIVGLISLESKQRIREIAIRKVNGATTVGILEMLNLKYLKLVVVSYIISLPLAYYIIFTWLGDFEYKIDITPLIFVVTGIGVIILTVILVTIQSYKAATTNPSEAMKY